MASSAVFFGRRSDKYGIFSNFTKCQVVFDGLKYDSVENAFQAAKVTDVMAREEFCHLSPSQAKAKGRKVDLRPDWEQVKIEIMLECLRSKFMINQQFKMTLTETGNALILENTIGWRDNIWGRDFKCFNTLGKNFLGLCLMRVRAELTGQPIVEFESPEGMKSFDIIRDFDEMTTCKSPLAITLQKSYDWLYSENRYLN